MASIVLPKFKDKYKSIVYCGNKCVDNSENVKMFVEAETALHKLFDCQFNYRPMESRVRVKSIILIQINHGRDKRRYVIYQNRVFLSL